MSHSLDPRRGHLAMLCFSLLVGGAFSLGSLIANEIAPAALTTVRFIIAFCAVGVLALFRGGVRREHFRSPWRYLLLGGIYCIYFLLMFEGLKTAAPVSASAVFTLAPLLSAGFAYVLLRQRTTWGIAAALVIGAAGALWVIFRADFDALLAFEIGRGESIFFWGVLAHAVYTPLVRKLNRGEPPLIFTLGTILAAALVVSLWGWRDLFSTAWSALPPFVWGIILYLAIVASAVTFTLLQYASLRLPSSKVMAYTYLIPTFVIVWQLALGGEPPEATVLVGIGLCIVALLMLLGPDPETPPKRAPKRV